MIAIFILVILPTASLLQIYGRSLWSIALMLLNHRIHCRLHHHHYHENTITVASEEVKVDDGLQLECVICLGQICPREKCKVLQLCNHGFHVKCIDPWLQHHSTCPLCRTPISGAAIGQRSDGRKHHYGAILHSYFLSTLDRICKGITDPLSQELISALCEECNYL